MKIRETRWTRNKNAKFRFKILYSYLSDGTIVSLTMIFTDREIEHCRNINDVKRLLRMKRMYSGEILLKDAKNA